jgi:antirestriction protein
VTVCQDCGHIKLYEHEICGCCGSDNVKYMLSAEEYAIHDSEGFGPFNVSEYSNVVEVVQMAEILTSPDSEDNKYAIDFLAAIYGDLDIIQDKLEDVQVFHGSHGDYAEELTECCYEVPEYWFNYDAMGRDLEINGETVEYVCLSLPLATVR